MAGKDKLSKLRKENEDLRRELLETKDVVQRLTEEVHESTRNLEHHADDKARERSVEFIGDQYDQIEEFRIKAIEEIKIINERLGSITARCNQIAAAVDELMDYSYQYNIKIIGIPLKSEREDTKDTTSLCLNLFHALGAKDVTMQDIDISHRVPARRPTNYPDAIVCKFVRRIAKEQVMAARKQATNIHPSDLGFPDHVSFTNLGLYDHLSPRLQNLLYEAKKVKSAKDYRFCWSKNGAVFLRKSETSRIIKLKNLDDLRNENLRDS